MLQQVATLIWNDLLKVFLYNINYSFISAIRDGMMTLLSIYGRMFLLIQLMTFRLQLLYMTRSLVVSDLRSDPKGSRFESGR